MSYNCCIPRVKPILGQATSEVLCMSGAEEKDWSVAQCSKLFFSFPQKSTFCISVEINVPETSGRVEKAKIQAAWGPSPMRIYRWKLSVGVGPLSFTDSKVTLDCKNFMLPFAEKLYGEADFIFHRTPKSTNACFNDKSTAVLAGQYMCTGKICRQLIQLSSYTIFYPVHHFQ